MGDISYQSLDTVLLRSAEFIKGGDDSKAKSLIKKTLTEKIDITCQEYLKRFIFLKALYKKFEPKNEPVLNLYTTKSFDTDQIELFNILVQNVPTVAATSTIAIEILARFLAEESKVTLLDIGIGTGRQEIELIKLLKTRSVMPRDLTIIGVEPNEDSLMKAKDAICSEMKNTDIVFNFIKIPKPIEEFDYNDWSVIKNNSANLIVNSSFAMHHVIENDLYNRENIIRKLKELNARSVVLSEPNSDHNTKDFFIRFKNCWKHFGLTFNIIDELDITSKQKGAIKLHFFGREIEDILGNKEEYRSERHEPLHVWSERLTGAGYKLLNDYSFLPPIKNDIINISKKAGIVGMDYKGDTLTGVMCGIL